MRAWGSTCQFTVSELALFQVTAGFIVLEPSSYSMKARGGEDVMHRNGYTMHSPVSNYLGFEAKHKIPNRP